MTTDNVLCFCEKIPKRNYFEVFTEKDLKYLRRYVYPIRHFTAYAFIKTLHGT